MLGVFLNRLNRLYILNHCDQILRNLKVNKSGFCLVSLFLSLSFVETSVAESEFHTDSGILTIPTVKVGNSYVYDAQLRLNNAGSFDIIGYSQNPSNSRSVDDVCTDKHITLEKYQQIKNGMTLDQVNSIIGCKEKLHGVSSGITIYKWNASAFPLVQVAFDSNGASNLTYIPSR
ncbi:hypothetical protein BPUTEOMOX_1881 [methanotrophic endosymbiont of Bathymodiolus puteoserpentis (Logatchev)]|nr:hypothetical protein BPUTEOMOX_1881 [methanotrophic endosymbiont of Bathymodiolus puteoserpentis (Logatchev)]